MAVSMRYPRSFFAAALILVAIGAVGVATHDCPATPLGEFIPSLLLTTVVLSVASCALLTAIFNRTRERSLAVLALMFLALSGVELGILLTIPLPGSAGAVIAAGDDVAPYLSLLALLVMPCGAIWYAVENRLSVVLPLDRARRLYLVGLPAALAGTAFAIVLVAFASHHLPPLVHGNFRNGFRRNPLSYVQVAANLFAVAFLFRFATPQQRRGLNLAILLAIIASASASIVVLAAEYRYGLAAIIARGLIVLSATFVLVAAMRNLVERLADGLRIEADALRTQAVVFERNAAVEVSLVKSRFVAMVSHELRTPLAGIIGMAELLRRSTLDDRQRSWTQAIHSSADTLLRVVNDLLDFSRVESGKVELEEIAFDVAQVVEDMVVLFREQARLRGVDMLSVIDPSVPRTIAGDRMRVKQVLQNLLNNAVRFTERGSIRVDVTLEDSERGQLVRWDVHDTGIGIAPGAQDRIFEAFAQEDASTARRFGGTGLGLAIARHLVELMGGHLTVRSVPGRGSTFTFTIPYRPVNRPGANDETPVRAPRRAIDERPSQHVHGIGKRASRPERILVAEDNAVNQELLVAQLAHLGFRADVAGDGDAVVTAVADGSYALVFMDCQMPGVDGFDAARRIRARGDRCSRLPIIAVTANVLPGYRERCLAAGMDDFLAKPALIAPLAAVVDRWLPLDAGTPVTAPAQAESARRRLLEIFDNDTTRVDALIARSLDDLTAASLELRRLLDLRDAAAARVAHKAKGIALETGLDAIAAAAYALETSTVAGDWSAVDELHAALVESLERHTVAANRTVPS